MRHEADRVVVPFLCRLRIRLNPSIHAVFVRCLRSPKAGAIEPVTAGVHYCRPVLPDAMPAFALRFFVGPEALPPRLSEFDLEQFFTLLSDDVAAIRAQFRSDHRLPAALMLLFMRVAGRPLDGFNVLLPRSLLRKTAEALAVSPPSIASLRSIYQRRQTLSKHQLWAKTYLGLRELEPTTKPPDATLLAQAADASHPMTSSDRPASGCSRVAS